MRPQWRLILICLAAALVFLGAGLLVPAHLRALDAVVVRVAGQSGTTLADDGQTLAGQRRIGAARLVLEAAKYEKISGWNTFATSLDQLARQYPDAVFWGNDRRTEDLFGRPETPAKDQTFGEFIIRRPNRDTALDSLRSSPNAAVQELLRTRSLTRTAIFSPPVSAAGQAFDAAVATTGLLLDGGHLTTGLGGEIQAAASQANQAGGSLQLEDILMDFTSLGERFNWDQLTAFTANIPDVRTLDDLAATARDAGDRLPVLFATVRLSGRPAAVSGYLRQFSDTGMNDLGQSLRSGAGGIGALLREQKQLNDAPWQRTAAASPVTGGLVDLAARLAWYDPGLAMTLKWAFYLFAGFLFAMTLHFIVPQPEEPLRVRGVHWFRELLFSPAFLLVVLLVTEPFLSQAGQEGVPALRLFPSTTDGSVPAGTAGVQASIMNVTPTVYLTLLVFLVLQALIYLSCLVKLAEIRRQNVAPPVKLKLLENEDHLFDAGLYLGFVGTICSLIIASVGMVKFSLMAAYSSTSFGIIFVVIFKIFHLRPARRQLLMETEIQKAAVPVAAVPAAAPASPVAS